MMSATTEIVRFAGDELTTREAAKLLRVDPSTIRNWSRTGYRDPASGEVRFLPRLRVGRGVRYKEADLLAFVAECSR